MLIMYSISLHNPFLLRCTAAQTATLDQTSFLRWWLIVHHLSGAVAAAGRVATGSDGRIGRATATRMNESKRDGAR